MATETTPYREPTYNRESSRRITILIALISFLFASVWSYVFFLQKPRVADGAIDSIVAMPYHTEYHEGGTMAEGYGGGTEKQDQMLIWVRFHMRNVTADVPLFETGQRATFSLPDGEQKFAPAESPIQVAQLRAYLKDKAVPGTLMARDLTLSPNQTAAGIALFVLPITKQVWDSRREFSVAIAFQYQRDLALKEVTPAQ